jgi:hypothetical protein
MMLGLRRKKPALWLLGAKLLNQDCIILNLPHGSFLTTIGVL